VKTGESCNILIRSNLYRITYNINSCVFGYKMTRRMVTGNVTNETYLQNDILVWLQLYDPEDSFQMGGGGGGVKRSRKSVDGARCGRSSKVTCAEIKEEAYQRIRDN
jgi:hypothetical protein